MLEEMGLSKERINEILSLAKSFETERRPHLTHELREAVGQQMQLHRQAVAQVASKETEQVSPTNGSDTHKDRPAQPNNLGMNAGTKKEMIKSVNLQPVPSFTECRNGEDRTFDPQKLRGRF